MVQRLTGVARTLLGWLLVLAGLAALVLPGPGLLTLFAGLLLLSTRYEWARRRVEPVRAAAFRAAAEGVKEPWRIALSCLGIACFLAAGILWIVKPAAPGWWPLSEAWWLPGGWATGVGLIVSALMAAALMIYSYRRFGRGAQRAGPTAGQRSRG